MAEDATYARSIRIVGVIVREIIAVAFWVHALSVWDIVPFFRTQSASVFDLVVNILLIALIANYAIFAKYGWISLVLDLGYIYFLPFIYMWRAISLVTKALIRLGKRTVVFKKPDILLATGIQSTVEASSASSAEPTTSSENLKSKGKSNSEASLPFRTKLLRAFFRFSALWSIFVFTSNYTPFLGVVVIIVLFGAIRAFWLMRWLYLSTPAWVSKAESLFEKILTSHRDLLVNWDGVTDKEKIRGPLTALRFYEWMLDFIHDNRRASMRWALAASLILSVPFYVYISYLFSVVYFGIGKCFGIQLEFGSVLLDSLYMPFAWTEMPHNFLIRLVAGLQAIVVVSMGWAIFVRNMVGKVEQIVLATDRLRRPLQEESFRERVVEIQVQLSSSAQKPVDTQPTKADKRKQSRKTSTAK